MSAKKRDVSALRIDVLRQRVAAPELDEARSTLEREGLPGLLALANNRVARAVATRDHRGFVRARG
jgi:hypothetical protein